MRQLYPIDRSDVDIVNTYALPAAEVWSHDWHLRANMVSSVDGATGVTGGSAVLTTPGDRAILKIVRDWADVIVVGTTTAATELYPPPIPKKERQEQRLSLGSIAQPRFAVVSNNLSFDPVPAMFSDPEHRTIVFTHAQAPADRLAAVKKIAQVCVVGDHAVDLRAALDWLAKQGLPRVLCEGGPRLLGAFLSDDLVDEMCLTITPQITGDPAAIPVATGVTTRQKLQLGSVLEEDGALFLRYLRGKST